jgi:AraC family transcriptional regulator, alkane utilization regulator
MDALSDALRAVKLGGAVYLTAEFSAPWCVEGRVDAVLFAAYLPTYKRLIAYHLVVEGSLHAQIAGDDTSSIEVSPGEILVIPQGETHRLASARGLRPTSFAQVAADEVETSPGEVMRLTYGGGGARTRIVCGFLACDDVLSNPLIASLPHIFKVDVRQGGSAWLESSLRFAAEEAGASRSGRAIVLAKLSELLFVEAVRRYVETMPEGQRNWLTGLRDRFLGRALQLLHRNPAHPWTVDELAREVGLSRSALAQRFSDFLGQPPMQYLAQWRLLVAAQQLRDGAAPIMDVASDAGYESEAAFNRAFKREFGLPPAGWRRRERQASSRA